MTIKYLLIPLCTLMVFALHAQDKIYRKNGDIVDAKVKSVGTRLITYTRSDRQDGPDYSISLNDVSKIVYQSGFTDNFDSKKAVPKYDDRRKVRSRPYGNNIITVMPATYTYGLDGTIGDPGIGLCYERLLDDDGHFGFALPILCGFAQNKDYNNNLYYTSSYVYTGSNNYTWLSLMPGVKFYPADNKRAVRYSLGLSFYATFGSEPYDVYDRNFSAGIVPGARGDWRYTMYGAAISNSVSVSVTKHVYIEFGVNACVPFSDNRYKSRDEFDNMFGPIGQFILKTGVRL